MSLQQWRRRKRAYLKHLWVHEREEWCYCWSEVQWCYDETDEREIYPSIVGEKMLVGRIHILQCFLSFCDRQLFVSLTAPHGEMGSCVEKLINFAWCVCAAFIRLWIVDFQNRSWQYHDQWWINTRKVKRKSFWFVQKNFYIGHRAAPALNHC